MSDIGTGNANRLIREKSPYLLQHAHNPVDWYPWGEEAFEKAKAEDKPVFLSIGYSTCHWCHVMARECFEDEEVAELLNRHYVSIKVDREERPDVDQLYMAACQAMTGQGGWPLTLIMTPDQKPFFSGTYFPKEERWGHPGLLEILKQVADAWEKERETINNVGAEVIFNLQNAGEGREGALNEGLLQETYSALAGSFDPEYGGFGLTTKFPLPHNLLYLLRYWKETGENKALEIVNKTLYRMAGGGIYDQLGFGFHRYATDRKWSLPHFEKTLYDNALLAYLYLEAYQATGDEYYRRIAREIFTYVLRDMTSPAGGFFSAEDADSEGLEGEFYLWTPEQVVEILGQEEGEVFCRAFGITAGGNLRGKSIPDPGRLEEPAKIGVGDSKNEGLLQGSRERLFREREKRIHPGKDDKILTAWNGLMIAALAKGSRVLKDEKLALAAAAAAEFIWAKLRTPRGRLLASYRDGVASYPAYLDDYAFLTWGLIELYEAGFEPGYLRRALELSSQMVSLFWDSRSGGLFFSGSDGEELLIRSKEVYDGALPSGNSVASYNLMRLARLAGDPGLEEKGQQIFSAFAADVNRAPSAHAFLMLSWLFARSSPLEIIIAGRREAKETKEMLDIINRVYLPGKTVLLYPGGGWGEELDCLAPHLKDLPLLEAEKTTAFLCRDFTCQAPITELEPLRAALESGAKCP